MFSYWLSAQLTVPFWYKQILLNTLHDSDRLRHACSIMERMDDLRSVGQSVVGLSSPTKLRALVKKKNNYYS